MKVQYRPLDIWPRKPTTRYARDDFRAEYAATIEMLEFELHCLKATDIVIEGTWPKTHARSDGWPISAAKPSGTNGVILSFSHPVKGQENHRVPLQYACDRYVLWKSNLRAITLTLKALRAVDRYGCTEADQQYTGFEALPSPAANTEAARRALCAMAGVSYKDNEHMDVGVLRTVALKRIHGNGNVSVDELDALNDAVRMLTGGTAK